MHEPIEVGNRVEWEQKFTFEGEPIRFTGIVTGFFGDNVFATVKDEQSSRSVAVCVVRLTKLAPVEGQRT